MSALAGFPPEVVSVDLDARSVTLLLDAALYPLGALHAASYVFLDRCFLLLDAPDSAHLQVTLTWKRVSEDEAALERLVGEFCNELLSCAWRARIADDSRAVIEIVTARALAGALGAPSLDDLEAFDFGDEPLDDPLGIALSWEDKYGKKKAGQEP